MDPSTMLDLLRLQIAWGADEAVADAPVDRLRAMGVPQPVAQLVAPSPAAAPTALRVGPVARAAEIAAACATVEDLRKALAAFDLCALRQTATNLVFEDGNPDADLMLIGEAPGAEEDRTGLPFAGPAGHYMGRMFASIGLDRTRMLLTTLIPWRPPGSRPPTETDIALCLPFLLRHIALRQPQHIVLLGQLPARALFGRPAERRRGRAWRDLAVPGLAQPVPALAAFNPATAMTSASARRDGWADLRFLHRTINGQVTGI